MYQEEYKCAAAKDKRLVELTAGRGRRAPTKGPGTTERLVEQILAGGIPS